MSIRARRLSVLTTPFGQEAGPPGIDGVYVEIPIQWYVMYGGIFEAVLGRDCMTVHFDEVGVREMGGREEMCVRFELDDEAFADMREGLRFVFGGCECFREEEVAGS